MKILDLKLLFVVVAVVELIYALLALMPPSLVQPLTGWVLTSDGQWLLKLFGMALFSQAYAAWVMRKEHPLGLAQALALYQFGSATADWVMWIVLDGQGTFSTPFGQALIVSAIVSHYGIGILLIAALQKSRRS